MASPAHFFHVSQHICRKICYIFHIAIPDGDAARIKLSPYLPPLFRGAPRMVKAREHFNVKQPLNQMHFVARPVQQMGMFLDVGDDRFLGFAVFHFAQTQEDFAVAFLIVGREHGEYPGPVRAQ